MILPVKQWVESDALYNARLDLLQAGKVKQADRLKQLMQEAHGQMLHEGLLEDKHFNTSYE